MVNLDLQQLSKGKIYELLVFSHTQYGISSFFVDLEPISWEGLTQSLRPNYTPFGIRVAVIEPGAINKEVITQTMYIKNDPSSVF